MLLVARGPHHRLQAGGKDRVPPGDVPGGYLYRAGEHRRASRPCPCPAARTRTGLPVGAQLMGKAFSEPLLYRIGAVLERAAGYAEKEAE